MKILCVVNDRYDPPGIVGDVIEERGMAMDVVNPHLGDALPEWLEDSVGGMLVLGGLMHAFEDDRFPALARIAALMAEAHKREVPVLGLCLGAQLLARALGGRRVTMSAYEFGFVPLSPTPAGRVDPLLAGAAVPPIMQAHEDNFELPVGAELLLTGDFCRNQAFRAGRTSYGFQCHFEVKADMLAEWIRQCRTNLADRVGDDPQAFFDNVEREAESRLADAQDFARHATAAWLDLVTEQASARVLA